MAYSLRYRFAKMPEAIVAVALNIGHVHGKQHDAKFQHAAMHKVQVLIARNRIRNSTPFLSY
jgi:hypothetical protein